MDKSDKLTDKTVNHNPRVVLGFTIPILIFVMLYEEGFRDLIHLLFNGLSKGNFFAWIVAFFIGFIIFSAIKEGVKRTKARHLAELKVKAPFIEKLLLRLIITATLISFIIFNFLSMAHLSEDEVTFPLMMSMLIFYLIYGLYKSYRDKSSFDSEIWQKIDKRDDLLALTMSLILTSGFLALNVIYLINELQTKNGGFAGYQRALLLNGNYDDAQSWYFAKENKPKARFIIYNRNLNRNLTDKTVYEVTVYKGYFGDTIIPIKSLNNAKPLPNESPKWW